MPRFTADQLAFAASKNAYMGRDESIEFMKWMNIRHSVGHWSAGDFYDRFAPPGYHSDDPSFSNTFEAQCRRTKAAGVDAIEIHQSVFEKTLNGDLDQHAIDRARSGYLAELGLTISACNINTWTHPKFRLGGACNPDPALRRAALDEILKGVEICRQLEIPVLSVWPGSDGADYHFQIDYKQSIEWFTEALAAVNHECLKHGIKLAIEPKPYEPRELYMIIPTAASAIIVAQQVNRATGSHNCGLTIDYGHQKMEATTASTACCWRRRRATTHRSRTCSLPRSRSYCSTAAPTTCRYRWCAATTRRASSAPCSISRRWGMRGSRIWRAPIHRQSIAKISSLLHLSLCLVQPRRPGAQARDRA